MGEDIEIPSNSYEEARKRQLLENKKRFEDLGILNISKSLSALSNSKKKSKQREAKPKIRNAPAPLIEPRRSTRTRNPIVTYQDEVNVRFSTVRRRSKFKSLRESYLVRPVEEGGLATYEDRDQAINSAEKHRRNLQSEHPRPVEGVRLASYEDRVQAMESAEKLRINLQSEHPSFVLSMDRSHVYNCFWLGLPETFCNTHLPKSTVRMLLENEDGNEYECVFIGQRAGISSGWRAFGLEHKLEDGDALVFELIEQTRFKVYIVRVSGGGSQDDDDDDDDDIMSNVDEEAIETKKKTTRPAKKLKKTPGNRKKLTAKNSGAHVTNVDNATAETKNTSRPTNKLKKKPGNVKKLTAKNSSLATDGRSQDDDDMSNVNKAVTQTRKSSGPIKQLKKQTIDSPPDIGKKQNSKRSAQSKKPNKSVEVVTGTRRSTRIQH